MCCTVRQKINDCTIKRKAVTLEYQACLKQLNTKVTCFFYCFILKILLVTIDKVVWAIGFLVFKCFMQTVQYSYPTENVHKKSTETSVNELNMKRSHASRTLCNWTIWLHLFHYAVGLFWQLCFVLLVEYNQYIIKQPLIICVKDTTVYC